MSGWASSRLKLIITDMLEKNHFIKSILNLQPLTSWDIKDQGEVRHRVNSPPAMPVAQGDGEMWETRGPNHTVLVLFLCQRLDINKNIKKKFTHLHAEKKGKQQGELRQSIRLPESFLSEMIRFLLRQWDLIFLDSGMLQLWGKHCFVRLASALLKSLTYLTRDHALIKACTSLVGPPCSHWDSSIAARDTWKQSKTIKVITRWEYVSLSVPQRILALSCSSLGWDSYLWKGDFNFDI